MFKAPLQNTLVTSACLNLIDSYRRVSTDKQFQLSACILYYRHSIMINASIIGTSPINCPFTNLASLKKSQKSPTLCQPHQFIPKKNHSYKTLYIGVTFKKQQQKNNNNTSVYNKIKSYDNILLCDMESIIQQ